jgi:uncharacterized NAD-dependent epimerase/dehydratase family protein
LMLISDCLFSGTRNSAAMSRRMIILTEGNSNPHTAKTACSVIRYRRDEVVAVLDGTRRGRTAQELLNVGGDLPVVGTLDEAPPADTLLIGIAPAGGQIPTAWRPIILAAITRGMDVVSGLHDFISSDPEWSAAAERHGVRLWDVRKNNERRIARREGLRDACLRVQTVGHDCSVGKMVVAIETTRGLQQRGIDAKFVATGQTGIMVEGDGCPIDCVVADFVSGAAEQLVLDRQHHEVLLIEGQGSLVHPAYSAVTLGLLHGCAPHALILCYEVGRETVGGMPHVRLPPLERMKELNETMAAIVQPCPVIGIAMNSRLVTEQEARAEQSRVRSRFGLPVVDVFRFGAAELVDAVMKLREERARNGTAHSSI